MRELRSGATETVEVDDVSEEGERDVDRWVKMDQGMIARFRSWSGRLGSLVLCWDKHNY